MADFEWVCTNLCGNHVVVAVEGFSCDRFGVWDCVFPAGSAEDMVELFVVVGGEVGAMFQGGWWSVGDLLVVWEVLPGLWEAKSVFFAEVDGQCSVGVCVLWVWGFSAENKGADRVSIGVNPVLQIDVLITNYVDVSCLW